MAKGLLLENLIKMTFGLFLEMLIGFNNLKLKRIWAKVVHPNKRSIALLQKLVLNTKVDFERIHLEIENGWTT